MLAVEQQLECRRAVSLLAGSLEWKFKTENCRLLIPVRNTSLRRMPRL
jgi:hypothetical protein